MHTFEPDQERFEQMTKNRISLIFGTRPEAIKLCPLILAMQDRPELQPHVCVTAQHREMLDQVLDVFGVRPDFDLSLMRPAQSLASLTARAVEGIDEYLRQFRPDMVLVQGDTTTVFAASLASFYHRIPIGHVEAGLRTWNRFSPFPEEANRVLTSRLASLHFCPTDNAKKNLINEGIRNQDVSVTGNTVIDALLFAVKKNRMEMPVIHGLPKDLQPSTVMPLQPRVVLVTGHRRENFGQGLASICDAIATAAHCFADVHFVYPVHLNPNVSVAVRKYFVNRPTPNVHLIEPLSYLHFVAMMERSHVVLTDSGGIQEEAPSLGKPVLVTRDTTERPEAIEAGAARLVGTDPQKIVESLATLLTDNCVYASMSTAHNPYGDGHASHRVIETCIEFLDRQ